VSATAGLSSPVLELPERLRLRYQKLGRVRFTSQRDLARLMERAMRRASLPLRRSSGFSPRPLLSFGLALPTGCASHAEYLDLRLDGESTTTPSIRVVDTDQVDPASLTRLCALLSSMLPEGIDVTAAAPLHGPEMSLQEAVASCDWELEVLGVGPVEAAGRVERLLGAKAVVVTRERKGREVADDLRPSILSLRVADRPARVVDGLGEIVGIDASVSTRPRGVRPGELCRALGDQITLLGACRTHQWMENEDRTFRAEPLSAAGVACVGLPARTEVRGG
jgi:radical SAM-linked protein